MLELIYNLPLGFHWSQCLMFIRWVVEQFQYHGIVQKMLFASSNQTLTLGAYRLARSEGMLISEFAVHDLFPNAYTPTETPLKCAYFQMPFLAPFVVQTQLSQSLFTSMPRHARPQNTKRSMPDQCNRPPMIKAISKSRSARSRTCIPAAAPSHTPLIALISSL